MAVTYSSALMAAAACSFGAQADKEREASEWELLRGSAGPQIEEQGELASGARAWRPRGNKQTAWSATELQIQKF